MLPSASRNTLPISTKVMLRVPCSFASSRFTPSILSRPASALAPRGKMPISSIFDCGSRTCSSSQIAVPPAAYLFRGVDIHVVGSDHHHHHPRTNAVDFAMTQTPQDILGTIPTVTDISDFECTEVLLVAQRTTRPSVRRFATPEVRNRVAQQQNVRL